MTGEPRGGAEQEFSFAGWAVPEDLGGLHALVEEARGACPHVGAEAFMMLETAVIELANNVVEHGRPPGEVSWSFVLRVREGVLEGVLTDDGQEYEGDLDAAMPGPLAESGRGMPLANAALDELEFARDEGHNVWTMRRRY